MSFFYSKCVVCERGEIDDDDIYLLNESERRIIDMLLLLFDMEIVIL
jgi:hypothetical protein